MLKRVAVAGIVLSASLIGLGYASAFLSGGTPRWAAWLLAVGIPGALAGVMVLGAVRENTRSGKLVAAIVFIAALILCGFALAIALPANEGVGVTLVLGLPVRAAIVVYGIGLLPILVLPVVYALTFETQTLSAEDLDRVRELSAQRKQSEPPSS